MPREYKPLPPLWHLQARLKLSREYPSGLQWIEDTGYHQAGEMAGKWNGKYYMVRMCGDQFHAHRIVYCLRTGKDPGNADVMHGEDNPERDNRKRLTLRKRKTPKYQRQTQYRSDFKPKPAPYNGEPSD